MKKVVCSALIAVFALIAFVLLGAGPEEQWVMKIGSDHMPGLPTETALEEMKRIIEEETDGRIQVEIYMGGALGSQREMGSGLQAGTIEGVSMVGAAWAPFNATTAILDLPFLFSSPLRAYEIVKGELGDDLLATFEGTGIVAGAIWHGGGFRNFTGNFPIQRPEDYAGKRIRVTPNPLLARQFEILGATPVTIDFGELYTALQEGTVDGQENGTIANHSMRFYEVQDYMALSEHGWNSYITAFSEDWMNTLPEEYQQIVLDAARRASDLNWVELDRMEQQWLEEMRDYGGIEIYELTDEQRDAFAAKMSPVYQAAVDVLNLDAEGVALLERFIEEGEKPATVTEVTWP